MIIGMITFDWLGGDEEKSSLTPNAKAEAVLQIPSSLLPTS